MSRHSSSAMSELGDASEATGVLPLGFSIPSKADIAESPLRMTKALGELQLTEGFSDRSSCRKTNPALLARSKAGSRRYRLEAVEVCGASCQRTDQCINVVVSSLALADIDKGSGQRQNIRQLFS